MVAHTFSPCTWWAVAGGISEFEASLVSTMSYRTAKVTQRDPLSKKQKRGGGGEGQVGKKKRLIMGVERQLSDHTISPWTDYINRNQSGWWEATHA